MCQSFAFIFRQKDVLESFYYKDQLGARRYKLLLGEDCWVRAAALRWRPRLAADTVCSVPDATVRRGTRICVGFRLHIKVMFTWPCSLLSALWHYVWKNNVRTFIKKSVLLTVHHLATQGCLRSSVCKNHSICGVQYSEVCLSASLCHTERRSPAEAGWWNRNDCHGQKWVKVLSR